jgi:hypothetical protein
MLSDSGASVKIHTVRGVGYILAHEKTGDEKTGDEKSGDEKTASEKTG